MPLESIRTQILDTLQTLLLGMEPPDYWYTPQLVTRYWLNPLTEKHYPHYSILTAAEDKQIGGTRGPASCVSVELPVTIAGAGATTPAERPRMGERMMADVERLVTNVLNHSRVGGASVRAQVQRTELELTEIEAPLFLVGVYCLLQYRHQEGDPAIAA